MLKTGLKVLEWLLKVQTDEIGRISPVGSNGWMEQGLGKAFYAQQPIEAESLVEACVEAFRLTKKEEWLREARRCFDWFLGRNVANMSVYDFKSGGCFDGLELHGVNQNMGAESTLAWLISCLTMYNIFGEELLVKKEHNDVEIEL